MASDPQNPYSAFEPETFQVQEEPEYLKALKNQAGPQYNPGTNTLTRTVGQAPEAQTNFLASQNPVGTPTATGNQPWVQDPGYKNLSPEQQTQFSSLMNEMEGYQTQAKAGGFENVWTSPQWEQWYPKQVELEDKWGWLKPTTEQRDTTTGALTGYQSIQGMYDYLQPGQYASSTDNQGNPVFYYKDPTGQQKGILSSPEAPQGLYDVGMMDLYGVSETKANPYDIWEPYKYPQLPGLGSLPTEKQNEISPYLQQISQLQNKIQELQNMRPGERNAKEAEGGESLTAYLANLENVQNQMATGLEGTGITPPQFNPLTGKRVEYQEAPMENPFWDPYSTQAPTPEQTQLSQFLSMLGGGMGGYNPYGVQSAY